MAILLRCPSCKGRQSVRNNKCKCGEDLRKARKNKRVEYWIVTWIQGRQKWELIGKSYAEAKDADGKRRSQKRADPFFDIKPDNSMTYQQLTDWYIALERIKGLPSFRRIKIKLAQFNGEYGHRVIRTLRPADLENLQVKRIKQGKRPATVDDEVGQVRTMVRTAFVNGMISGSTLATFMSYKKLLKKGANTRDRVLTADEFEALYAKALPHLKSLLLTGYLTGMRKAEILGLTRDRMDLERQEIRLRSRDVKTDIPRIVPMPKRLCDHLAGIPPALHDPHVFLYRGKPIKEFKKSLKTACKDVGILYGRNVQGGFTFHDLRHTFSTNMRKAGVPESVVMRIMGHETREMFDRYNTVDRDDAAAAATALENHLDFVSQTVSQEAEKEN